MTWILEWGGQPSLINLYQSQKVQLEKYIEVFMPIKNINSAE